MLTKSSPRNGQKTPKKLDRNYSGGWNKPAKNFEIFSGNSTAHIQIWRNRGIFDFSSTCLAGIIWAPPKASSQTSAGEIKSIPVSSLLINNCRISRKVVELFCGLVSSPGIVAWFRVYQYGNLNS